MRSILKVGLVGLALIGAGCARRGTGAGTGPEGTGGSPPPGGGALAMEAMTVTAESMDEKTPDGTVLEPSSTPPAEARVAYDEGIQYREAGDMTKALSAYDAALEKEPYFFEALHEKAWILASSPDPSIRNPKEALQLALKALDHMAAAGMLRKERDTYADEQTTGRMATIMGTIAGAMAADGRFTAQDQPGVGRLAAMEAACAAGGDAIAIQTFTLEAARDLDSRFKTESTAQAVSQAQRLLEMYKARKPPMGESPVAWGNSAFLRLR